MSKKIIFIATNALGKRSAEATHNVEMAVQFNKQMPVSFIGGISVGEEVPEQLKQILDLYMITCNNKSSKIAHIEYEFKVIKKIKQILKQEHSSIVYVRYRITGFFLFRFLIKNHIQYIVEYNDKTTTQLKYFAKMTNTWSIFGQFIRTNKVTLWLLEKYEAWVFFNSKISRAVTPQLGDYIKKITKNKSNIVVIPNATNINRFKPLNKNRAREKLKLPLNKTICIHIGSLTPWDGIQDMIKALPKLDNILFLVVGSKNQFYTVLNQLVIENNVLEKIMFTGAQNQEVVQQYIAASDICLLLKAPLDYGLSPIKYYEYMACGRPILTVNESLINNVIQDKCGDVLNRPFTPQDIAKKIKEMTSLNLQDMGNNARKAAEEKYTWEKRANTLLKHIL